MNRKSKPTINLVEFIDRVIKREDKVDPFSLTPSQRRRSRNGVQERHLRELVFRLVLLREVKERKAVYADVLALSEAVTNPRTRKLSSRRMILSNQFAGCPKP